MIPDGKGGHIMVAGLQGLEEKFEKLETRTDSLEKILGQFIVSVNGALIRLEKSVEDFKEEVRADTKKHKEEMNRRWGDLANKMGTLVEDMVAPNMPEIARKYFNDAAFDFFAVRLMKRKTGENAVRREFDIIAVSGRNFYIAETKSKPKPEHVSVFAAVLKELPDYFPEWRDKKIIPVFSSLYIPEEVRKHLTGHKIYAMGVREGTMDLLNFEELEEQTGIPK